MEEFAAQLDAAQLSDLCCGTGWGVQDENNPVIGASSESVPGAAGETTHALESYGVSSIVLADGPGGVRITQQFEATDLESGKRGRYTITVRHGRWVRFLLSLLIRKFWNR